MMKTIVLIILLLFGQWSDGPKTIAACRSASRKLVLFDLRDAPISTPKITPATERMVLSKLFRRYLTDSTKCDADFDLGSASDPLLAARNASQITPSITDALPEVLLPPAKSKPCTLSR